MAADPSITNLIPHRPPFLWVDRIIDYESGTIVTEKDIDPNLDIFKGHYPDHPLLPGVILCEAIFQSGALLMAKMAMQDNNSQLGIVPVLTRIGGARFKRPVKPGDTIRMKVTLKETVSSVAFFKGTLRVNDEVAVRVDFSCAMTHQK